MVRYTAQGEIKMAGLLTVLFCCDSNAYRNHIKNTRLGRWHLYFTRCDKAIISHSSQTVLNFT